MADAAVVLVHGLFSSAATWADISARIAEDTVLGSAYDIHYQKYDSPKIRLNPLRSIPDFDVLAADLAELMDSAVSGYDAVVLVGHSQGGLVIQRYLARMIGRDRGLDLARVKAVVLLACPNSGSELGMVLRRAAKFWNHPQEKQLRPINERVMDAHTTVINRIQDATVLDARHCPIPVFTYAGTTDNVVTPASASGHFRQAAALPGDHSSILEAASPSSRTFVTLRRHLIAALESRDAAGIARTAPEAISDQHSVRHNLAPLQGRFFDREQEIGKTLDGLDSPYPVVSVTGLGGMGKSTVASRAAWRCVEDEFVVAPPRFDVIVWSDQSGDGATTDTLIDTISRVMGYPYLKALSMPEKLERAVEHLNSERCLLILDNFSATGESGVLDLIARIDPRHSKVLVTSRIGYPGECWPVEVGGLDDSAGRALLTEEAQRLGISATAGELGASADDYLSATGGNPLVIKLTTSQIRYGGDDLASVTANLRNATDSAVFDAIFDRSWNEQLAHGGWAQSIIMAIALHSSTATRDALAYAVGISEQELREEIGTLTAASFVEVQRDRPSAAGRFRLHPLTRAYALNRLNSNAEQRAGIEKRLIEYYRRFAGRNSDIFTDPDRVHLLEGERRNIIDFAVLAFERAGRSDDRSDLLSVLEFAEAMAGFLWGRGYWRDRVRLCENAAIAARAAGEPVALARQYALIGRVHAWLGDFPAAREFLDSSESVLPPGATLAERRETIRLRGHIASGTRDYPSARALFGSILDVAEREAANDEGRAATLVELGICAFREGELSEAIDRFEEARQLDLEMGTDEGLAVSVSHLANALFEAEQYARVRPLFEQGLELANRVNRQSTRGRCHLGLARLGVAEKEYSEAARHAVSACDVFGLLGMREMFEEAALILDNIPDERSSDSPRRDNISGLISGCRAVIFDFDDTLAATMRSRWPVLIRTAGSFGVELRDEVIRAAWGMPLDRLISTIVPTLDREIFKSAYLQAMALAKPVPTLGAASLVEALHTRGVHLSIVSSSTSEFITADLRELELDRYFRAVFGSNDSGFHKPDPRSLRPAINALTGMGIDRADIVCVGDSVRDLRAAAGNGLRFIATLTGLEGRAEFRAAGLPDGLMVANLAQVGRWL
ncbi:alpha/beta fold hydrolase [Nocardia sp. NPDC019395]|uniref:alpha/beta fold hydrolase n=1 Tax=Nocardia sp. NPDC019395 TaxID=3154686 RepID=UPI0033FB3065